VLVERSLDLSENAHLFHVRQHLVRRPPFCIPVVVIISLRPCVHHKVDRRASAQHATNNNDWFPIRKLRRFVALVKDSRLGRWLQVLQIKHGVNDVRNIFIVCTAFDNENREKGQGFSKSGCNYTACSTA
jgi:hypothetical protein